MKYHTNIRMLPTFRLNVDMYQWESYVLGLRVGSNDGQTPKNSKKYVYLSALFYAENMITAKSSKFKNDENMHFKVYHRRELMCILFPMARRFSDVGWTN